MLKWSEITAKLFTMKDMVILLGKIVLAVFMLLLILMWHRVKDKVKLFPNV